MRRAFHANIIKAGLAADIYATVTAKDENNVLTLSIAGVPLREGGRSAGICARWMQLRESCSHPIGISALLTST